MATQPLRRSTRKIPPKATPTATSETTAKIAVEKKAIEKKVLKKTAPKKEAPKKIAPTKPLRRSTRKIPPKATPQAAPQAAPEAAAKIAPKKKAPKETAPKMEAPKKITPKKINPEMINPEKITPEKIAPKEIAPKKIAPKKIAPKKTAPKKEAPTQPLRRSTRKILPKATPRAAPKGTAKTAPKKKAPETTPEIKSRTASSKFSPAPGSESFSNTSEYNRPFSPPEKQAPKATSEIKSKRFSSELSPAPSSESSPSRSKSNRPSPRPEKDAPKATPEIGSGTAPSESSPGRSKSNRPSPRPEKEAPKATPETGSGMAPSESSPDRSKSNRPSPRPEKKAPKATPETGSGMAPSESSPSGGESNRPFPRPEKKAPKATPETGSGTAPSESSTLPRTREVNTRSPAPSPPKDGIAAAESKHVLDRFLAQWRVQDEFETRGLKNEGDTCYRNSVIQCLLHQPLVLQYLINGHTTRCTEKSCVTCRLRSLAMKYIDVIRPHASFAAQLERLHAALLVKTTIPEIGTQSDAHELLTALWYQIAAVIYPPPLLVTDPKVRIFDLFSAIMMMNTTTAAPCPICTSAHSFSEENLGIGVNLTGKTPNGTQLSTLVHDSFSGPDNIVPNVICGVCEEESDRSNLHLKIVAAPAILVVQLRRFDETGRKLDTVVRYPELLDLNQYRFEGEDGEDLRYRLGGVVMHWGRKLASGHYIAHVRNARGEWMLCDDDVINPVTLEETLEPSGKNWEPPEAWDPYLLFYERVSTAAQVVVANLGVNAFAGLKRKRGGEGGEDGDEGGRKKRKRGGEGGEDGDKRGREKRKRGGEGGEDGDEGVGRRGSGEESVTALLSTMIG